MTKVFVMHNVVKNTDSSRMIHRNCFDHESFSKWLQGRSDKFVSLSTALQDNMGDCITIDDATMGAFDAAMLCAVHHHHATLFVNPYYIVEKKQYWMHYLTLFIEQTKERFFSYHDDWFDLSLPIKRKKLRKTIKGELSKIADEDGRIALLEQIFHRKISEAKLPYHLQTLSEEQLDILLDNEYVDIEYHGWTHGEISSMTLEQVKQELKLGRTWFRQRLNADIHFFSLPFGKRQKQIEEIDDLPFILMDDCDYPDEFGDDHLHNRILINLTQQES